ncbi:glycosyltransferase family 4 protein [Salinibacter ruber]|uniref:glycosyltransferase family 4 protein n=1 Tax=Salinibacter ruber TaxID=146919 RepID=UPI000DD96F14|nr:glycosyltransferase family 4 protein [Salinibacter ruber]
MKIGTVAAHFPPEINAGSVRLGPFVEAWAEEGNDVHVFTHRKERQTADPFADVPRVQVHRVALGIADNTRSLPVRFINEASLCFLLFWKSITQRVDVYVTSSPPFLVAATTLLISLVSRTPFVLDVRDLHPEQLFTYGIVRRESTFGKFLSWIESQIYDHAALIVAVTEGMCSYIRDRTQTPTALIQNGIDTRKFYRYESLPESSDFTIIFHGILARSQNVELIVEYGKYLKRQGVDDVVFQVIGDGPKRDILMDSIDEHDLSDVINYVGFVDHEDITDYVNQADVGFSPRVDGFINKTVIPVKVYECLGCGLPVVVTPRGEAGAFVAEEDVGFQHANDDLDGIHKSIMALKEDQQLYQKYSGRAVEVAQRFDRRKMGRNFYELMIEHT